VLLVIEPALVRDLLIAHAADTTKGPRLQRIRPLLGDGLLTSEGETHRRLRRLIAPAFARARLERYTQVMGERARRRATSWRAGGTLDVHAEMAAVTIEVVGETLLGVDLTDEAAPVRRPLQSALAGFANQRGPLDAETDPPDIVDPDFEALIQRVIADHIGSPDRGDVVSALLAATDDEAGGRGLTEREVRDNVVTLLLAGHETTANALSWTFHLLGEHPELAARLHRESASLGGRAVSFDELPALPYTRAVVKEAMRLYPPAWSIGRSAAAGFKLGDWEVEPGTTLVVSPWVLHRRSEWFPEPERFDPDRWLDARADHVPRHAYLPFGLGSRACIGEQFAWTELVIILAVVAGGWRLEPQEGHVVEPQYRVTVRPRGGLPMVAQRW
jgi:cytochrome P450